MTPRARKIEEIIVRILEGEVAVARDDGMPCVYVRGTTGGGMDSLTKTGPEELLLISNLAEAIDREIDP